MSAETDWIPGVVAVGLGLLTATGLALWTRRGAVPAVASELDRQRDALYEQIRALDADPNFAAADKAAERHRLVIEAARILQTLAQATPTERPLTVRAGLSPAMALALGLACAIFGGATVYGLDAYSKPKPPEMPAAPPADMRAQRVTMRKAAVDADPTNAKNRIAYTKALIDAGDIKAAFDQTLVLTENDPNNADARTLQAVILLRMGDAKMATDLLDKVLSQTPDHVDALGYRGAVYLNDGQFPEAIAKFERVIALDPTQAQAVQPLIEMAKTGTNPFGSRPVQGGAANPGTATPATPPSSAPSPSDISGTITSDAPAAFVFVYLRPAGQDRGPPAAVKKFSAPSFPLTFTLGPGDSPMGGAFPDDGTLTIRTDSDGNPTTREHGMREVRVEHVKPGQSGVVVAL